jgi:tRNA pseudouridine38-40 synthase
MSGDACGGTGRRSDAVTLHSDRPESERATRYRLLLEYDGSEFWGWQVQPDRRTVQGTLEAALLRLLDEPIRVIGAGRTDRGCHATGQVAHFDSRRHDPAMLRRALPGLLPSDLRLRRLGVCDADFHARFGARSRHYVYLIGGRRSALTNRYVWCPPARPALARMQVAVHAILGEHDFRSFAVRSGQDDPADRDSERGGPGRPGPPPVGHCRVLTARWDRWREGLRFHIEADRFLTRMVRMLVGTLIEIGTGRLPPTAMAEQLASAPTRPRPAAAPAAGLYLAGIRYESAGWRAIPRGRSGARAAGPRSRGADPQRARPQGG